MSKLFLEARSLLSLCAVMSDNEPEIKKPSIAFLRLVNEWADSFIKARELPVVILDEGKKEGLPPFVIHDLIVKALKSRGLSERTILKYLPVELKDKSKIHFAAKTAANDDNNDTEKSYTYDDVEEDSEIDKQLEKLDNIPATIVPPESIPRQQTIDEFLDGYADGERSFYFQDVSMTFVRTQLLTRKGVNKFRRVFFEVE